MSERPSWMPTDKEILGALRDAVSIGTSAFGGGWARLFRNPDPIRRLIERAVLKGQIEVADEIAGFRVARFTGYELADRLAEKLRARLSELEGSHE